MSPNPPLNVLAKRRGSNGDQSLLLSDFISQHSPKSDITPLLLSYHYYCNQSWRPVLTSSDILRSCEEQLATQTPSAINEGIGPVAELSTKFVL
ncbi:predicted protein [Botrytis cinerea T4]|uniref:Uncharacterized protein n=1 Tax=Botryotinia fuckeliana (strain T4) TaxID=999810 RepID=G2YIR5_BOTF4|nr:predicted protein [Botrytis cinerea T4]